MGGPLEHAPHGYCPLCEGLCNSGIEKPPHNYPFVAEVDRAPDPAKRKPAKKRKGRRMRRPAEDRMHRPEEDR